MPLADDALPMKYGPKFRCPIKRNAATGPIAARVSSTAFATRVLYQSVVAQRFDQLILRHVGPALDADLGGALVKLVDRPLLVRSRLRSTLGNCMPSLARGLVRDPRGLLLTFTFTPERVDTGGLVLYRPEWTADAGNPYTLDSSSALLTKAGAKYYELTTGQPYHPAGWFFGGPAYTLTAPDGSRADRSG